MKAKNGVFKSDVGLTRTIVVVSFLKNLLISNDIMKAYSGSDRFLDGVECPRNQDLNITFENKMKHFPTRDKSKLQLLRYSPMLTHA